MIYFYYLNSKMSLNRPIWKLRDWIDEEKIDWYNLSLNSNAIDLLKKNPDKIDWYSLSGNKNAIELFKENLNHILWSELSRNPSIFELDYEAMKKNNQAIYEELIKEVMKPSRVFKNPDYDYIEELFGD